MIWPYKLPYPNLVNSELLATGNTMALLTYDHTMFDDMVLPPGVDLDSVVNCILEMHGHAVLYHPDPLFMKRAIKAWSQRRCSIWMKLLATTTVEYNPINNYDRNETITESTTETRSTDTKNNTDTSSNSNTTAKASGTDKHDVSAENTSEYQPDNMDTSENASEGSTTSSGTSVGASLTKDDFTRTWTHKNVTQGNIGVTTTQEMLQSERKLVRYSVIEEIAQDYHTTFCLDIY